VRNRRERSVKGSTFLVHHRRGRRTVVVWPKSTELSTGRRATTFTILTLSAEKARGSSGSTTKWVAERPAKTVTCVRFANFAQSMTNWAGESMLSKASLGSTSKW
jgi:hypothetical protein